MRIAVVGAGISGLSAAYQLGRHHETVVYEASSRIGGHTHTVAVQADDGEVAVDTGFIVYNERNYPLFRQFLDELNVATQPSVMSFGVRDAGTGIEYSGSRLGTLFAQPMNALSPSYWRFLAEILRFNKLANAVLEAAADPARTLGDFLAEHRFSTRFCRLYILPMASAIWSTGEDKIRDFPLFAFVRFFANHGLIALSGRPQWRVISGGSSRYVDTLCANLDAEIRAGTPVAAVRRDAGGVDIVTADGASDRFDALVLACHSDEALSMLGDAATGVEREILGAIPYAPSSVVLHTDESLLPRSRAAWSAWNYWCDSSRERSQPAVTYSMNTLQNLATDKHYLVTLNRDSDIRDEHVIRRLEYAHPQFSVAGLAAQQRHAEISGANRSYFCGAYWGYGFHEDGMASARRVVEQINDDRRDAAA